jgi:RNA polymerase sigma-70 factor, ECF subfamily
MDAIGAAPPAAIDDATLARRIAGGDVGAFALLMRRYNRRLYRVARAALRDDAEAEDALQEAYLQAFRALAQFRGEAALSTWLTRVVLNECLARRRRAARRENVIPMTAAGDCAADIENAPDRTGATPEGSAMRTQMRALLEGRIDALPFDLRTVFVMRAVEDMSVAEVSACLGIPEATVRSRHFRARSLLRDALAREVDLSERDAFGFDGARCDRIVAAVLAVLGSPG